MIDFLISNDYLANKLQRDFASSGFSPEIASLLFMICFATILMIIVFFIGKKIAKSLHEAKPIGRIDDTLQITDILNQAMIIRSKFELFLVSDEQVSKTMYCSLLEISGNRLLLELPTFMESISDWKGKLVKCYFSLPVKGKFLVFYNFISIVKSIQKDENEILNIIINIPNEIYLGQKRNFLRIEPLLNDVKSLRIWPSAQEGMELQTNIKKWSPMVISWGTDKKHRLAHIKNISQGGLKLVLDSSLDISPEKLIKNNYSLFVYFELVHPNQEISERFFFNCRIHSHYRDFDSHSLILGLQFIHQGKIGKEPGILEWEAIDPQKGADSVGNWVFKHHMALYRKTGFID